MTKKYKPIPIEDYGIVVDDNCCSQSIGTLVWNDEDNSIYKTETTGEKHLRGQTDHTFAIIGSIGKRLDGVPLIELANQQNDMVNLSMEATKNQSFAGGKHEETVAQIYFRRGYKANTNKYSEEDFKEHLSQILDGDYIHTVKSRAEMNICVDKYLQSLQKQPIPTEIEVEMECAIGCKDVCSAIAQENDYSCQTVKIHNKETNTITAVNYLYV